MNKMDINYKGTGIKTVRILAYTILIIGSVVSLFVIANELSVLYKADFSNIAFAIISLFGCLLLFGLCLCIATIAENSIIRGQKNDPKSENQ